MGGFRSFTWTTVSTSLGSSLISNSFLILSWVLLNCVIIHRISSHFSWINICSNKLIHYLPSLLKLLRIQRRCHVQIDFLVWRGDRSSVFDINSGIHLIFWIDLHLLLEVNLWLRIVFISVFYFLITLVDQMVASSDMVMTVIFNTFSSILVVKFVLFKNFLVEFLINRHLFFARELFYITFNLINLWFCCKNIFALLEL
jgi:hypothetical protein